jgi:hypothetical protein
MSSRVAIAEIVNRPFAILENQLVNQATDNHFSVDKE